MGVTSWLDKSDRQVRPFEWRVWHVVLALLTGIAVGYVYFVPNEHPTISRQRVPASLHCTEEEVIDFNDDGNLVCLHRDYVENQYSPR